MFTAQINIYIFIIFIYLSFLHPPEEDNDVAIISHKGTVDYSLQGLSTGGRIHISYFELVVAFCMQICPMTLLVMFPDPIVHNHYCVISVDPIFMCQISVGML